MTQYTSIPLEKLYTEKLLLETQRTRALATITESNYRVTFLNGTLLEINAEIAIKEALLPPPSNE
jgi:hypothetical protein